MDNYPKLPGKSYWIYTHFQLNHDDGRKGKVSLKQGLSFFGGLGPLDSDDDFYFLKPTCHSICQVAFPAVQVLGEVTVYMGDEQLPSYSCYMLIIYMIYDI